MNCLKLFLLAFTLLGLAQIRICLAAGNTSAGDADDLFPSKQYLLAYESLSTAEWLAKREMNEDAVDLYKEALRLFLQISSDYPRWQTNLLAFRVRYCRESLNKIRNAKASGMGRQKTVDSVVRPSRAKESLFAVNLSDSSGVDMGNDSEAAEAAELERAGDVQAALAIYKVVLAQNNQNSAALGGAGRCLLKIGKIDEARNLLFQWSVIPSPDNGINLLLALLFSGDRQYAKAIQLADIVINEDVSDAAAHLILGVALAGSGQTDLAMSEMHKAVALNPSMNEAHYNLALLILKKEPDRVATARAYYLNALKFGATPDPELAERLRK